MGKIRQIDRYLIRRVLYMLAQICHQLRRFREQAADGVGGRRTDGVILIVGAPIKSIYEMLIPKEYIDEIGDRNFKRGEGVALLQGSELRFIKIPMVRDMEKMQQICIDALTREESPVEGG